MSTLQSIVLAAGHGTRMKSAMPKVLHELCGRPMLLYVIDQATTMGVSDPVVVLGGDIAATVKPLVPKHVKIAIQAKPLGTGDAVLCAKKTLHGLSGDLLVLYADVPLVKSTTIHRLVETHRKTGATCTLLTASLADPSGYGRILRNETGAVAGIVEDTEVHAAHRAIREVNVGPFVCQTSTLMQALAIARPSSSTKERYLTQIIGFIARQEGAKIQTVRVDEAAEAEGVNTRADLARAIGVMRQRIVEAHLKNGVTIEDPQTAWIDYGVTIGADTVIRPSTVVEHGVSIGKRCAVGPFARLRAGVTLADEVRVGSFAELVRTKVGPRVKINHVSYLGDAVIEEGVNIGAGTVIANYDGQAKHQTQIGKGAFIGSDTVLIAPVKIGAGAVTGAGSVIPKAHDVPARGVVVGVPARPLSAHEGSADGHGAPAQVTHGTRGASKTASTPRLKRPPVTRAKPRVKPRAGHRGRARRKTSSTSRRR